MKTLVVTLTAALVLCAGPVSAQKPANAGGLQSIAVEAGKFLPPETILLVVADTARLLDSLDPSAMLPKDRVDPARLLKVNQMRFDYIQEQTGVDITGIKALVVFATSEKTAGLLLPGAKFDKPGPRLKEQTWEEGAFYGMNDGELQFDLIPLPGYGVALFFERKHTTTYHAYLKTAQDAVSPLAAELDRMPDAWVAVVFNMSLPKLKDQWAEEFGFPPSETSRLFFKDDSVRIEVSGPKESLDGLMGLFKQGRAMALAEVAKGKESVANENFLLKGLFLTVDMLTAPVIDALEPKLNEAADTLTLEVKTPSFGAFWLLGISSAVAIPAFIKYQRRASTNTAVEKMEIEYEKAGQEATVEAGK
jgi:hypothetical protein